MHFYGVGVFTLVALSRIGNLLVQQDAKRAEIAAHTALGMVVVLSTFTRCVSAFSRVWFI